MMVVALLTICTFSCGSSPDGDAERTLKRFAIASGKLDSTVVESVCLVDTWPVIRSLHVVRSDLIDTLYTTSLSSFRERGLDRLAEGAPLAEVHEANRVLALLLQRSAGTGDRVEEFTVLNKTISAEIEVVSALGNPRRVAKFTLCKAAMPRRPSTWVVVGIEYL
jgi:hypothetical protein